VGQFDGKIRYAITGGGVGVRVISDFGQAAAYPEPQWSRP
jgi:hypothetical protein